MILLSSSLRKITVLQSSRVKKGPLVVRTVIQVFWVLLSLYSALPSPKNKQTKVPFQKHLEKNPGQRIPQSYQLENFACISFQGYHHFLFAWPSEVYSIQLFIVVCLLSLHIIEVCVKITPRVIFMSNVFITDPTTNSFLIDLPLNFSSSTNHRLVFHNTVRRYHASNLGTTIGVQDFKMLHEKIVEIRE